MNIFYEGELMMRKTILGILLCGIILLEITGCGNKKNFKLNLPKEDKLKNITLEKNSNKLDILDEEEIKNIIYVLNGFGEDRTTKEESVQDYPVNANEIIKIEFNFKGEEKGKSILFIYKKGNKSFIEVPYNGIYKINEDEYNSIEKYIR